MRLSLSGYKSWQTGTETGSRFAFTRVAGLNIEFSATDMPQGDIT